MSQPDDDRGGDLATAWDIKLFVDVVKHVATLDTAVLVVLVTFLERFEGSSFRWLVGMAMTAVLVSLAFAGVAMFVVIMPGRPKRGYYLYESTYQHIRGRGGFWRRLVRRMRRDRMLVASWCAYLSFWLLFLGAVCLVMYVRFNFIPSDRWWWWFI